MSQQEIKTYQNQRIVYVNKSPCDKEHLYTSINLQALEQAMNTLKSAVGIKLWLYIGKNQNKWTFALSSADFMKMANCGEKAYRTAFQELVDQGFLIPYGDKDKNGRYIKYQFNEWGKTNITRNVRPSKQSVIETTDNDGFVF